MAEGKTPGDAVVSPFGDHKGSTQAAGPYSGAHDFLTNPKGSAPPGSGRDFTKESRPQKADGPAPDINADSVPDGGKLPYPAADPKGPSSADAGTLAGAAKHKPFKLG